MILKKILRYLLVTFLTLLFGTGMFPNLKSMEMLKSLEDVWATVFVALQSEPPSCAAYLRAYNETKHLLVVELNKSAQCTVKLPSKVTPPLLTTFDNYKSPSSSPGGDNVYVLTGSDKASVQAIWLGNHVCEDRENYAVEIFNNRNLVDSNERFKINLNNDIIKDSGNVSEKGRNQLILKSFWALAQEKAQNILSVTVLFCVLFIASVLWSVSNKGLDGICNFDEEAKQD